MKTFDYVAFKAAFRASATAHGIDPVAGATSYQVANLKADLRIREQLAAPDYGWATANGRNINSDDPVRSTQIVLVDAEVRPVPTWLLPTVPSELQKHQEAWGEVATAQRPRARAVWRTGAGLPERELIAN